MPLLGKTLSYTTDLSGAGCGCGAAVYLVNMHQNGVLGGCDDYYCDANKICGTSCAEVDLQMANVHAWRTALHVDGHALGVGVGWGGGGDDWSGAREWSTAEYGPNGTCINTLRPFQVAVSFPTTETGKLLLVGVEVSQEGCTLPAAVGEFGYDYHSRMGMAELAVALGAGMTPVVSYFADEKMLWLDGKGADGRGPCARDSPEKCAKTVLFRDFSVKSLGGAFASHGRRLAPRPDVPHLV